MRVFSFASELGSIATFAGLITAGIAVALQSFILSVVGYFFLIGKYGIRVGDRVQVAGVTGEVVDIGLVRFHMIELISSGQKTASGRVVTLSNSASSPCDLRKRGSGQISCSVDTDSQTFRLIRCRRCWRGPNTGTGKSRR